MAITTERASKGLDHSRLMEIEVVKPAEYMGQKHFGSDLE